MSRTESPAELVERLAREREAQPPAAKKVSVAITGGRDHIPGRREIEAFWGLFDKLGGTELHHGDARGVDRYVAAVVRRERPAVKVLPHPADWNGLGRAAGLIRNRQMLVQAQALIAFPGGRGTAHAVRTARDQGKTVLFVSEEVERRQEDLEAWGLTS